jgi:hypothetical protein
MDVFGSVGTAIDLAQKIYVYIKDVKDGDEDRLSLLREITALQAVLGPLKGRWEREKTSNASSPWLEAVATLGDPNGPLEQCKASLGRIESKLKPGEGIKGAMKKMLWPFSKSEIREEVVRIERLKLLVSLLLENALVYGNDFSPLFILTFRFSRFVEQMQKDVNDLGVALSAATLQILDSITRAFSMQWFSIPRTNPAFRTSDGRQ